MKKNLSILGIAILTVFIGLAVSSCDTMRKVLALLHCRTTVQTQSLFIGQLKDPLYGKRVLAYPPENRFRIK
jgi:hypothetical protein